MKTKKFEAFDNKPPIIYRPGTSDEAIIQTVLIERKEYLFPMMKPASVFDIGANIGVVSVILANVYPDAIIHAFEPDEENYYLLKQNVFDYKNIHIYKVALGNKTRDAHLFKSTDNNNLGGFSTHIENIEAGAKTVSMLNVQAICEKLGVPDLIKIDCEGAEYEILSAIEHLDECQWITGELHGINDFALLQKLSEHFDIQTSRNFKDPVWHFNAAHKKFKFVNDIAPTIV